ncbi:uncharacterized protein PHACADRAFT_198919 [Phanerochaete carnosa HHB-10118-sp]|uniref:Uncharacterized protein n=1 Tax=Phanerochaete carnosa (strain HHB-10118-sp) TaxID=650164 RepID=K5USJ3_PHACS|nr:uncharacterized protein PHACADRAFT_198919 [Phanerochaete carnosa HHB-10118-sp]EKM52871.1 hypothetical protein PHACADRAFT_198919 [Phanerochaete carnosa HHB-10118-sp]
MSGTTGADLPPEILSRILHCVTPARFYWHDLAKLRRWKHEVVASSLVCKYWSEAIRPLLFKELQLHSAEDVQFLKNIIGSPEFTTSSLSRAIQRIHIHQEVTEAKSWFHHVHGLSARLRETKFDCTVVSQAGNAGNAAPMPSRWAPFASMPSITPSSGYVRLSWLRLSGVVFTSTTELARLVDNFPTLKCCVCNQVTFSDLSPVVQSRRTRRRTSLALCACTISRCKDMTVLAKAALAADILAAGRRMGLDGRTWDATLQALLALVPNEIEQANVELDGQNGGVFDVASIRCYSLDQGESASDYVSADVNAGRPNAGQDAGTPTPLAHVESITLQLSFANAETVDTLAWEALRAVVDSPHMRRIRIRYSSTWALDADKLQFWGYNCDPVTSADILSVPAEHTIDGTTIALDTTEQAEWLLRPVRPRPVRPRSGSESVTREKYLRQLVAARVRGVSTDTSSGTAPPTTDSTQHTVLEQTHEAADIDV